MRVISHDKAIKFLKGHGLNPHIGQSVPSLTDVGLLPTFLEHQTDLARHLIRP